MTPTIIKISESVRRGAARIWFLALTVVASVALMGVFALPALAAGKEPPWEISQEPAPELDYTLSAGTAVLTFGLLIAFLVMLFVLSEREFKGVINERFGPKK